MAEEEAQCRDDAVHHGHRNAGFALLDLEPPHVLAGRGVRRTSDERGEARNGADVAASRRYRESAQSRNAAQAARTSKSVESSLEAASSRGFADAVVSVCGTCQVESVVRFATYTSQLGAVKVRLESRKVNTEGPPAQPPGPIAGRS